MNRLTWSPSLDTGIEELDRQHRTFLDLLNQLRDAHLTQSVGTLNRVLETLAEYAESHHSLEAALWGGAPNPAWRESHARFLRQLGRLRARVALGENVDTEIHVLLDRWLFNHIRNDALASNRSPLPPKSAAADTPSA